MNEKRKINKTEALLLGLPLFAVPLLLLLTWSMENSMAKEAEKETGLNLELPQAALPEGNWDKLEVYEKAEKEKMLRREREQLDPYVKALPGESDKKEANGLPDPLLDTSYNTEMAIRETRLMEGLDRLKKAIGEDAPAIERTEVVERNKVSARGESPLESDIERLEGLMKSMSGPSGPDPEMEQLEGMLDKILDVQHPERVMARNREKMRGKKVFRASAPGSRSITEKQPESHSGGLSVRVERNGFYGLDGEGDVPEETVEPAMMAHVPETQIIADGGRVKLELLEPVSVNGTDLKEGTAVYGQGKLQGERLSVHITSVRSGKTILPVDMEVFDYDALPGIPIPGTLGKEIAQSGSGAAIAGLPNVSSGLTLETRMASAGLETAKGLFRKKTRAVKVTLKAGHPVLLVDRSQL